MTAAEARAAEVVAAVPQEVFATADVTPALYFAFLGSSLTFAVTTVRIHSPPAITPRVAPRTSRAILRAIALVASPAVKGSPLEDVPRLARERGARRPFFFRARDEPRGPRLLSPRPRR